MKVLQVLGSIVATFVALWLISLIIKLIFKVAAISIVLVFKILLYVAPIVAVIIFIAWIRKHYFRKK